MNTGASILSGSALARNGAVTMDTNHISACVVPEPSGVFSMGVVLSGLIVRRRLRQ